MTLTEFLLARIAEDEAIARHGVMWDALNRAAIAAGIAIDGEDRPAMMAEGAPGDPAHALRRCAADRQIVEEFGSGTWVLSDGTEHVPRVARLLATVYADHPDYREEWAL